MSDPRIEVEEPYVGQLTVDVDEKMLRIRLDKKDDLPFWFECWFSLRGGGRVLRTAGRTGQLRPDFDVEVEKPLTSGYLFKVHDKVNDRRFEFTVRVPEVLPIN